MISILDSEDMVSTHSENRLEGKCVDLPEEQNQEAAEVEENVPFLQEEITLSLNLPKTEEMNVSKLFSHFLQNRKRFASVEDSPILLTIRRHTKTSVFL